MDVLVVDSASPVRARLVARLREAGLDRIREATTHAEALEHLGLRAPEAIVLDVDLTERTGLDLLRDLRRRAPQARVIVFTNALPYRRWCLDHGADHFLDKSLELEAVVALLGAASDRVS